MNLPKLLLLIPLLAMISSMAEARDKPAPAPSRYGYTLKIDEKSLPAGVSVREVRDHLGSRHFIKNTGDKPLVISAIYHNEKLVSGNKLVGGKVYGWFPNGVPMEGKQHLKGWQAPFGDIEETILFLPREPAKIYEGREKGLDKTLPPDEPISMNVEYDGQPYAIKATVVYHLNPEYDRKP